MWPIIPSLDPLLQVMAVAFTEPSFRSHRDILLGWIMCIGKRTEYRVFQTIQASSEARGSSVIPSIASTTSSAAAPGPWNRWPIRSVCPSSWP